MSFSWRWLLILFAFVLGGGQVFAASREERAYTSAIAAFQDGMWNRAETELADFRERYPDSTNVPQAVLLQAQAEFKQGEFPNAITVLQTNMTGAGPLADQYVYWIGEAQIAGGQYAAAAKTLESLAQNYPDSSLRLRAVVDAASARAKLDDWAGLAALLEATNGVFQRAVQMDSGNELVSRGRLLLAQAKFIQNDFTAAADILEQFNSQTLTPELDWQHAYLLCHVRMASGDLPAAFAVTTNMLQIAKFQGNAAWRAESIALRAGLLEKLNHPEDAIAEYQKNLTNAVPVEQQKQAVLKIADLSIAQNEFTNAEQSLSDFLIQFSNAPSADVALLTLGELHLKNYAMQPSATNDLSAAQARFDQFVGTFTNSPLLGKAYLDRGWCEWLSGDMTNSLSDFQTAATLLPRSDDLAVAKFKAGDAQFALDNSAGALTNYLAVREDFPNVPVVAKTLGDRALYQSLRANLELHNLTGASNDVAKILERFPNSILTPNSDLLYGEALSQAGQTAEARKTFEKFEQLFPDSPLRPQVEFAITRTYELEQDWTNAVAGYQDWLKNFPTNEWRPRAGFALARASFESGDETNAYLLFTNFVAEFPSNNILAPQAQYWVGDHFFRANNFPEAEKNYKYVFQNWPSSDLAYPAKMMAGRAAMGWQNYPEAIDYFTSLTSDTNCPPDLQAKAMLAHGDALMRAEPVVTNNPAGNFQLATNVFSQVITLYPSNELAVVAQCQMGDCDLQLGDYAAATNAYAQVFAADSPANVSLRSRAQIRLGVALEKMADTATPENKGPLLRLALNNYLDVFYEKNLRDGEAADEFWVKKAGLQALPLVETLHAGDPNKFIDTMETWLPQLKDSLEKARASLSP